MLAISAFTLSTKGGLLPGKTLDTEAGEGNKGRDSGEGLLARKRGERGSSAGFLESALEFTDFP